MFFRHLPIEFSHSTPYRRSVQASMLLLAGFVVYWFFRDTLPQATPDFIEAAHQQWARLVAIESSAVRSVVNGLPSFFHCYALLAAAAACTLSRRALLFWGIGFSALLCLVMEGIQHPIITSQLSELVRDSGMTFMQPLIHYSTHGVYDPIDIYAILFATALAFKQFYSLSELDNDEGE